jgi:hypothetical protein
VFLAIAVDNLANAQELTAAEEEQQEEDREKAEAELQREIDAITANSTGVGNADGTPQVCLASPGGTVMPGVGAGGAGGASDGRLTFERKGVQEKTAGDDDDEDSGPKPMLPYSAMFICSPTNP